MWKCWKNLWWLLPSTSLRTSNFIRMRENGTFHPVYISVWLHVGDDLNQFIAGASVSPFQLSRIVWNCLLFDFHILWYNCTPYHVKVKILSNSSDTFLRFTNNLELYFEVLHISSFCYMFVILFSFTTGYMCRIHSNAKL